MIYDFRDDIKELLDTANSTEASLNQCATAIEMYLNLWKHSNFEQADESNQMENSSAKTEVKNDNPITVVLKQEKQNTEPEKTIKVSKDALVKPLSSQNTQVNDEPLQLTARQTLAGTQLLDDDGVQRSYLNEAIRRKFNITDGDLVTVKLIDGAIPYIISVENRESSANKIETFSPAIVEQDGDDLVIRKTANGETLENIIGVESYIIDESVVRNFNLKAGDVVTLAWYENAFTETARINWKFDTDVPEDEKRREVKKTVKSKNKSSNEYKPRLDFDLNNPLVAVVTADDSVASNLSQVANAHHGILGIVSGENAKNLINHLSKYGMVIMIKGYINHEVSGAIVKASQHGQITDKIAMANTKGQLTFEKALYRASKSIDLDDKTSVNYPEIED